MILSKEGCVEEIYKRADDCGRMLPDGLEYIDSWISLNLERYFQFEAVVISCSQKMSYILKGSWIEKLSSFQ